MITRHSMAYECALPANYAGAQKQRPEPYGRFLQCALVNKYAKH